MEVFINVLIKVLMEVLIKDLIYVLIEVFMEVLIEVIIEVLIKVLIELVWPSMGWRRLATYAAFRISRLPNSPRQIATGFALGAAISFTPFIGFHILGTLVKARIYIF